MDAFGRGTAYVIAGLIVAAVLPAAFGRPLVRIGGSGIP